jgi:hypothetical protein
MSLFLPLRRSNHRSFHTADAIQSHRFAGGAVVASQVGNAIAYDEATLAGMKFVLVGNGVFEILLLVAPLLVTTPTLRKANAQPFLG